MIAQTYTVQAPIREYPSPTVAFVDLKGTGAFVPDEDAVVMAKSTIDGQAGGGASLDYTRLKEAVVALGGHATSAELAKHFADQEHAEGEAPCHQSQDGVMKEGWTTSVTAEPPVPRDAEHPAVDYSYQVNGDGTLSMEYTYQRGVAVLRDGDVAVLDNDGNGKAEPDHDSLLIWKQKSDQSRTIFSGIMPYARLSDALTTLGGTATEAELYAQLSKQEEVPGTDLKVVELVAWPDPLAHMEREVVKTFHQTPEGGIFVDYKMGEHDTFRGGWQSKY